MSMDLIEEKAFNGKEQHVNILHLDRSQNIRCRGNERGPVTSESTLSNSLLLSVKTFP